MCWDILFETFNLEKLIYPNAGQSFLPASITFQLRNFPHLNLPLEEEKKSQKLN
jgi:hypothetical protein